MLSCVREMQVRVGGCGWLRYDGDGGGESQHLRAGDMDGDGL